MSGPPRDVLPGATDQAAVIVAECWLEDACDKRVGPRNDVHADRRPELYRSGTVLGAGR